MFLPTYKRGKSKYEWPIHQPRAELKGREGSVTVIKPLNSTLPHKTGPLRLKTKTQDQEKSEIGFHSALATVTVPAPAKAQVTAQQPGAHPTAAAPATRDEGAK